MSKETKAEIMAINRLRMGTDGAGVSTLIVFHGCHLGCTYCLNPQCKNADTKRTYIAPEHLVQILSVDDIYFRSTGGGIVFGGGEPLLQSAYIREVCKQMPPQWQKRIETSLNVPWKKIEPLLPYIDEWIIDIKDSDSKIYKAYTGIDGTHVYENVCKLSECLGPDRLLIRIPEIPDYNTAENVAASRELYSGLGKVDEFRYRR